MKNATKSSALLPYSLCDANAAPVASGALYCSFIDGTLTDIYGDTPNLGYTQAFIGSISTDPAFAHIGEELFRHHGVRLRVY